MMIVEMGAFLGLKPMENVRDQVLKIIKKMPARVTVDEIMSELYFKLQVDRGIQEVDEGRVVSHEHVKKRVSRWLKR